MRDTVVHVYVPRGPVQAGCYRNPDTLDDIVAWINQLRARHHIGADVHLTIEQNNGVPIGLLVDPHRSKPQLLRPTEYLVFGHGQLTVSSGENFHSGYIEVQKCIRLA